MVKVVIDNTQPKQKVVTGKTDKKIVIDDGQEKQKVVTGTVEKNVAIDPGQEKQRVVVKKGPKGDVGPQGPAGAQGIQGPAGSDGADGAMTIVDVDTLEMEMAFTLTNLLNFKETSFTSGLLTNISTYTNSGKSIKLFNKDFIYDSNEILTTIILTRISDSNTLTKNLLYNIDGTLKSIDTV